MKNINKKNKLIVIVCLSLLFIGTITFLNYPQYAIAYASCGFKAPVIHKSSIGVARYYVLPSDETRYSPEFGDEYLCTEQEAVDKGLKHDPMAEAALRLKDS